MPDKTWEHLFIGPTLTTRQEDRPKVPSHTRHRGRQGMRRRRRAQGTIRSDIQGLRMVAVVAVVANHLTGHPIGGFVGVDVFFVISGFLITSLLLREGDRTGKISWAGFYRRRVKRLVPAALTVTLATVVAAFYIFDAQRFHDTVWDAFYATIFAANWRMIHTNTDYFQAQRAVSPMQHYWSLSVEEQFYVVWPLVLVVIFAVCSRTFGSRQHATRVTGSIAATALVAGSLWIAQAESGSNTVVAYFSTVTRGWELGLGAVLAVTARYMRGGPVLLTIISWAGTITVIASLFLVNSKHFPFPGAIAPCLGAALVLVASTENARPANFLLTNKISGYLGDISYSIYLVHFPVIIFVDALIGQKRAFTEVFTVALTLGLSILLFEMIEDPIRKSGWLRTPAGRGPEVDVPGRPPRVAIAAALCVLSLAAFVVKAPNSDATLQQINAALATQPASGTATSMPRQHALTMAMTEALQASSWPAMNPRPAEVIHGIAERAYCATKTLPPASRCSWGAKPAKHTIYLVGDSTSLAYSDAFITMINDLPDWRVRVASGAGCAFSDKPLNSWCPARNRQVVDEIRATRPDVLVVTDVNGRAGYIQPTADELKTVSSYAGKIVVLPAPPQVVDVGVCYTKQSKPSDCVGKVTNDDQQQLTNEKGLARQFGGTFIDPTPWVCVSGLCPAFVGTIATRRDQYHITPQYAAYIGPVVEEAFQAAGAIPSTTDPLAQLQAGLAAALKAAAWPALNPPLDVKAPGLADSAGCTQDVTNAARCTFGDHSAKHLMYLVGDSTSAAYSDAFVKLVAQLPGWRVRIGGALGCAFADVLLNTNEANPFKATCTQINSSLVDEINRNHPDLVIETSAAANSKWLLHIGNELNKIKASVGRLAILPVPPLGKNPSDCFVRGHAPSNCVAKVSSGYAADIEAQKRLMNALGGVVIDPTGWFSVGGYSPMFVGKTPMRRDALHITPQYAALLAPVVGQALVAAHLVS